MVSVGVNVVESVCGPAPNTVPVPGEYEKLPGVEVLAFSCEDPSAVPYVIADGVGHEIDGVALMTVTETGPAVTRPALLE